MKAAIQDRDVLRAVSVRDLASYLRGRGWQARPAAGRQRWTLQAEVGEFEVEQPLDQEQDDYARRLAEAFATLAVVEDRPQPEILRDVRNATVDVVRVRLGLQEPGEGTVPLVDGAEATGRLRDMLEAAACAAVEARPAYGPRKPDQVAEYLRDVRLGQTEMGSFVLTLLSPLPPLVQPVLPETADGPQPPFARRVTLGLAGALEALRTAAGEAAAADAVGEAFDRAVARGVSANLCQAASGLARASGGERLDLRFTWGRTWPVRAGAPGEVRLTHDAIRIAEAAADYLRERAPRPDLEVQGAVVRLQRAEGEAAGMVTLRVQVEGRWRSVQIVLPDADYQKAIQAHGDRSIVTCVGELVREGRGHALHSPRDFGVIAEAEP